jgi:cellulose 1,4-beta-cellobiosidase
LEADRSQPGIQRGPCSRDSGKPEDVEKNFGGSSVKYMNIRVGPINSTFKDEPAFLEQ